MLKGTQTEKNLWLAFAGESQAQNKYAYYAEMAKKEGLDDVAKVFTDNSNQEQEHARLIFQFLNENNNTETNIKISAQSESYEANTMYKEYERVALEEGFENIAKFFREIAKIEIEHERKRVAGRGRSGVQVIDVAVVPQSGTDASHGPVQRGSRTHNFSHAKHGIRGKCT